MAIIRGDSHDSSTLKKVKRILNKKIDIPFIDGNHSYKGVKQDFKIILPSLEKME